MSIQRRLVAVSEDTDIGLRLIQPGQRFLRHAPFFIQHVAQCDLASPSVHKEAPGKSAPFVVIHIAGYHRDRSELPQVLKYSPVPDISCMKDFSHTGKMLFNSRIIEPVRIGNHSNPKRRTCLYGVATGSTPSDSWMVFH